MKPRVSIVIEAYNEEHNALAFHDDTLQALLQQDFPLDEVELIMIGTRGQVDPIDRSHPGFRAFCRVQMVVADAEDAHYWQLKNQAAQVAAGDIVAFVDSDARPVPQWLRAIVNGIEGGADVVVGPSQYRTRRLGPDSPWMLAAALPTWGFVLARTGWREPLRANSLLSHNVGLRREVLLRHPFRAYKRSFVSSLLFFDLMRSGARVAYQPAQRVAHGMTYRWWLRAHVRRGWETYMGRDADPSWPRFRMLERLKFLEPIALRLGLVLRDGRHWFRYSRAVGLGQTRAACYLPIVVPVSLTARCAEMVGMYAALTRPRATEHWARF